MTIHKYQLAVTDKQSIAMPGGARVLCVLLQRGLPCLWAVVNPDEAMEYRTNPTGQIGTYLGTYQLDGGALVFHCFEEAWA